MKKVGELTYLSIGQVAYKIGRSSQTIKNWYRWAESEGMTYAEAGLPEYRNDLDGKGTYYFTEEATEQLREFKKGITYGKMSAYNVTRWGSRGKDIESRREHEATEEQENSQEL